MNAQSFLSNTTQAGIGAVILRGIFIMIFSMPLITVLWLALTQEAQSTAVPRYALNSLILVALVSVTALVIGVSAAFVVVRFDFRWRKLLEILLILPLALPAFLVGYALVEFFDFAGPLQVFLRDSFGFGGRLPKFRSLAGAVSVLGFALYPYVYIYARQGLLKQSRHQVEAARVLGLTPWQSFLRVELPSLRPALAIGLSLVALEVLADFGTVDHFGIETLSTGIFTSWLQAHQLGSAARMALMLAILALGLLALEAHARRNASYVSVDGRNEPYPTQTLRGWRVALIWGLGLVPVTIGFVLPVAVFASLLDWRAIPKGEWLALGQSVGFGICAAALILTLAVAVNYGRPSRTVQLVGMVGYALPGAVLGLGILIPLGAFDHLLAHIREIWSGGRAGLLLTGSGFALVLAYVIRFFALGNGAISEAKSRLSPNLVSAARLLGKTRRQAFWQIEMPQLHRPMIVAALLVFIDVLKELPATLILRPFGVQTLATRLYEAAALEDLSRASLSALLIAGTGVISVFILIKLSD